MGIENLNDYLKWTELKIIIHDILAELANNKATQQFIVSQRRKKNARPKRSKLFNLYSIPCSVNKNRPQFP